MDKIWLEHYAPGVPHTVDVDVYPSIPKLLTHAVSRYQDNVAFTNLAQGLSFRELDQQSDLLAAFLRQELSIGKGDRVAIVMPNLLQYLVSVFGALKAGAAVVNVNPLYTPRELHHQLSDSGAKSIVIWEQCLPTLDAVIDETQIEGVIVIGAGEPRAEGGVPRYSFQAVLEAGARASAGPIEVQASDVAFLQYTGGTTGVAKGASLTHRNILANIEQFLAVISPTLKQGEEVILTALPIYHIFALVVNCLSFVKLGAKNVLIANPRDIPSFVESFKQSKVSVFTAVNTLFNGLLHAPGFAESDHSRLKLSIGGGMAVQRSVAERWAEVTGCQILEGYGLSETSPVLSCGRHDLTEFTGTIGMPIPSTEMCLRDEAGNDVPLGEPGEICARGPQVMAGYWNRPDETQEVMTADGFFRTGDIATVDERGYFRIIDRRKDMILVSGFNVFPNEIEEVVVSHPAVLEAACIGVPDASSGEAVKIFVVRQPDTAVTVDEIRDYCRQQLTAYKVPRHVEFIDEVPKSAVGKILRRELRK